MNSKENKTHVVFIHNNTPKSFGELQTKVIKKFSMVDGDTVLFHMVESRKSPYKVPLYQTRPKGWRFWKSTVVDLKELELTQKKSWVEGKYFSVSGEIKLSLAGDERAIQF